MDIMFVFKAAGDFFIKFCNMKFTVAGYHLSVSSFLVFSLLLGVVITFIRRLGD